MLQAFKRHIFPSFLSLLSHRRLRSLEVKRLDGLWHVIVKLSSGGSERLSPLCILEHSAKSPFDCLFEGLADGLKMAYVLDELAEVASEKHRLSDENYVSKSH